MASWTWDEDAGANEDFLPEAGRQAERQRQRHRFYGRKPEADVAGQGTGAEKKKHPLAVGSCCA